MVCKHPVSGTRQAKSSTPPACSTRSQQSATPLPAGAFIMRLPEVMRTTGLSKSTLYALMRAGEFVPSIALGARAVGWPSHLVQQWLADRMGGTAA